MKSYYEVIENISKGDRNQNYALIAKQIIINYLNEKIISQLELANSCFLSKSSITKFCKKLGLSGYRELQFHLKNEINVSLNEIKLNIQDSEINLSSHYLKAIEKAIEGNANFIKKITEKITETKQLSLVVSYSMLNIFLYLKRLLFEKNINVELIEHVSLFSTIKNHINLSKNIIFICIARDNETLNRIYDMVEKKDDVFVITTEKQQDKFPKYKSKLVVESEDNFFNHAYRQIMVEMLFLNIFHSL